MAKLTAFRKLNDSKQPKPEEELEVDEVMDDDDEVAVTYDIASYPSDLTLSRLSEGISHNSRETRGETVSCQGTLEYFSVRRGLLHNSREPQ